MALPPVTPVPGNPAPGNPAKAARDDEDDGFKPGLLASVPLNDGQVKGLKIAVTIMTGILVLGVLTLFGRIIYLVARPSPQAAAQIQAQAATQAAASTVTPSRAPASAITVPLPLGAVVRHSSLSGERLVLHYDSPTGSGIVIVDTVSGQIISRVELQPGASKP
jgi:uncharacterized iron-regulated membrane protein